MESARAAMKMLPSKQQSSQCRQIHTGVYLSCYGKCVREDAQGAWLQLPRKAPQEVKTKSYR